MTLSPRDLSNLQCWYKADSIFNLSSGDALSKNSVLWPDSGPNGYHISTLVGTSPTWASNAAPNSRPAVQFSNGLLQLPASALGMFNAKGGAHIYSVASVASTATNWIFRASTNTNSPGRFAWDTSSNPQKVQIGARRLDTDSFVTLFDFTISLNTFYINSGYIDWTNNAAGDRENGGTINTHASVFASGGGLTSATNSASIEVGGNSSTPAYLNGYLAELFVFDRVLTVSEQAQMDTYLSTKYGITVGDMLTFVSPAMGFVKQRGFL